MNNIWNNICNVIYESQYCNIFKSLKIPIYGFVTKRSKTRIMYIFKYFILVFCKLSKFEIKNSTYDIVFFLPYKTPSNTENLLPVVKSCLAAGKNPLLILGEGFYDRKNSFDLPYCDHLYISKIYGNVNILLKISYLFTAVRYFAGTCKSFKIYPKIMMSMMRNPLSLYFHIYSTLFYHDIFNNIFLRISSKCAISTADFWPPENQFVQSAIEHGYDTYLIQHGIISEFWFPFEAKYYFVWGEIHKKQLVRFGAPEENLLIVGMPALDKNTVKNSDYNMELFKSKKVLIISQTQSRLLNENNFKKYASCLRIFDQLDGDYTVTVKLHPNEDMRFYDRYGFSKSKYFIFIKHERPIHDLIIESDLCITLFSTGGLETIALNRALVVMNIDNWIEEIAWWPKYGGGLYIPDEISLRELLMKLSKDVKYIYILLENQKEFMRKSFSNYGNASNTIVNRLSSDTNIGRLSEH